MMDNLNNFWHMLEAIWGHVVNIFVASLPLFKAAWTFIVAMLLNAWDTIKGILEIGLKIFLAVFKAIVDVLKTFWSALVDIFGGILDIIGGTIGVIVDLLTGHWGMAWESFVKILRGAWSIVKGVLDLIAMPFIALWDLIKGGFVALGTAISEFFTFFLRTFDAIFHFAGPVIKFFLTLVKNIIGIWGDAGKWLLQAGGNIIQGLWDGIKTVWDSFIGFWKQIFQYIIDFFKNLFGIHSPSSVFSDFGISLITGLLNGITGAIGAVWDWFGKLGGWILGYFVDALTWLFDVGSKILTGLGNGIINGAIAVWDFYSGFYGKILGYFASALTWLWDVGSKLLTGLLNGVKNGAIDLGTWFGGLAGTVLGWVGDASKWLFDVGSNLLHGLSDGMESAFSWVFGKVKDFFMGLLPGWVKDLLGIHSPSTVFADFGKMTMYGFGAGINSGASVAIAAAGNAAMAVTAAFQSNMGIDTTGFSNYAAGAIAGGSDNATASAASSGGSSAGTVIMPVTINTQEINPLQHAAELGAAFANRVG
jgi:phage-related protein